MVTEDRMTMSDLAIPPGEYLEEVLEELGMAKDELARRMGRPASKLSHIFNGTKRITEATALQLEKVVGVPAHIWTGLESEYRLTLARNEETRRSEWEGEAEMVKLFCYRELAALKEVPDTRKPQERVRALHSYFGVTSLSLVMETQRYQPAFRCGKSGERSPEAIATWLRLGERRAQKIVTAPFNDKRLKSELVLLRALTAQSPDEFVPVLRQRLAASGVALVVCPHFPKTKAHGATFRMGSSKAVLIITVRGSWADIFWFSLFHEIGHILLHGHEVIVEDGAHDERESEADRFASDSLIPPSDYADFVSKGNFSKTAVTNFARQVGVHPGIAVGRLQHDGYIDHSWLNDLRVRLALQDSE